VCDRNNDQINIMISTKINNIQSFIAIYYSYLEGHLEGGAREFLWTGKFCKMLQPL